MCAEGCEGGHLYLALSMLVLTFLTLSKLALAFDAQRVCRGLSGFLKASLGLTEHLWACIALFGSFNSCRACFGLSGLICACLGLFFAYLGYSWLV